MRVCFLTTSYPRWQGDAAGDFVQELVNSLVRRHNVEITVIAPADIKASGNEEDNTISVYRCRYFWPRGLQRLAYGDGIPWNLRHSFIAWLNIPFLLGAIIFRMFTVVRRIDVIHANWGILGAVAIAARFIHRKPVVVMIHGTDLSSKNKLITTVTKWAIKHADAVITNSPQNYEFCSQLRGDEKKTYYINNGVECPEKEQLAELRQKYKKHDNSINLLSMARLIPERRYDIVLKAFAKVRLGNDNVFLTILGDGPALAQLKSLVKELGLCDSVQFPGMVRHSGVFEYIAAADVYVSATTVETHGSSVAEAAAFGLPVIVTKVGFPAELVVDGISGFVVEPNDEIQLAGAIEKMVRDDDLRHRAGETMRKRIDELGISWPICAEKTMVVYKDCLNIK
ncbi:MAG: glycosyltransferase family 4 protein [Sedimentisphaerales bacterium]|nr:glycosyltransferase family 4 protein [Sedimentisphaerales bacterium]